MNMDASNGAFDDLNGNQYSRFAVIALGMVE
jgi:hypothetical protein